MTEAELYLLLMDQVYRNALAHEKRCRRRLTEAEEDFHEARQAVGRLASDIEGFRKEMLRGRIG